MQDTKVQVTLFKKNKSNTIHCNIKKLRYLKSQLKGYMDIKIIQFS